MNSKSDIKLVDHPSHYNIEGKKECWDEMIDIFGYDAVVTFDVLSAFKYNYRKGNKAGNPEEQDKDKISAFMNHAEKYVDKCSVSVQAHYLAMKDMLGN